MNLGPTCFSTFFISSSSFSFFTRPHMHSRPPLAIYIYIPLHVPMTPSFQSSHFPSFQFLHLYMSLGFLVHSCSDLLSCSSPIYLSPLRLLQSSITSHFHLIYDVCHHQHSAITYIFVALHHFSLLHHCSCLFYNLFHLFDHVNIRNAHSPYYDSFFTPIVPYLTLPPHCLRCNITHLL